VVIHEFAHKLDMHERRGRRRAALPSRAARERWIEVFDAEFDRFCGQVEADKETFLDPYAAEHEAEFFAVASEAFFESPHALKRISRRSMICSGLLQAGSAQRLKT
jgi:Mlc titration factor MtfA (ptsG expression regulator)